MENRQQIIENYLKSPSIVDALTKIEIEYLRNRIAQLEKQHTCDSNTFYNLHEEINTISSRMVEYQNSLKAKSEAITTLWNENNELRRQLNQNEFKHKEDLKNFLIKMATLKEQAEQQRVKHDHEQLSGKLINSKRKILNNDEISKLNTVQTLPIVKIQRWLPLPLEFQNENKKTIEVKQENQVTKTFPKNELVLRNKRTILMDPLFKKVGKQM